MIDQIKLELFEKLPSQLANPSYLKIKIENELTGN